MNRFFLAIVITTALGSCAEHKEHSTDHSTMDSSTHAAHATAPAGNEMKGLMDSMMMKMHGKKQTGNIDIDYANMMLDHHQGAVDMANLQLAKGSNAVLKEFSKTVIKEQQREIGIMGEFISRAPDSTAPVNEAFKNAMDASMQSMMAAGTKIYNDTDKDFVAQMIPHHQSAVDMAKAYLLFGKNETLRKMSEDIVASQGKEIVWLKEWLAREG